MKTAGTDEDLPSSRAGWLLLWAGAALVLYVLSIGPVHVWALRTDCSQTMWDALKFFYAPVRWMERERHVGDWVLQYQIWCAQHWPTTEFRGRALYDPLF